MCSTGHFVTCLSSKADGDEELIDSEPNQGSFELSVAQASLDLLVERRIATQEKMAF